MERQWTKRSRGRPVAKYVRARSITVRCSDEEAMAIAGAIGEGEKLSAFVRRAALRLALDRESERRGDE